jgi:two-component system response regulator AtoC
MRKPGRVELAEGGTLFLDEIGDVSPVMQAKLLRLIQDREYERLGGTRTLRADVRFVAATHRDLEHMVETGAFREDLFYRLNVVSLWLPPLRARRDDIESIARHYLQHFRLANQKPRLRLEEAALRILVAERWPGNVRQLVNFVERLVVLARGDVITSDDVRSEMEEQIAFLTQAAPLGAEPARSTPASAPASRGAGSSDGVTAVPLAALESRNVMQFSSEVRPLKEDMRRAEYRAITKALASANGNRAQAARLLGVSRRTLYTKLDEHGID